MNAESSQQPLTPLQTAVLLLKQTQARLTAALAQPSESIAIVGIGCRFPGEVNSPDEFWRLLCEGRDAVGEVPANRWNAAGLYDSDPSVPGKMTTRWGGFLKRVDEFDAEFFGISPREAIRIDPQQRILLEVAWEALEDAGLPPGKLSNSPTGVYVGVVGNDYGGIQFQTLDDFDIFSGTGVSHSILANRLSYVLNLMGPSLTLDTACSSSLVALHLACQSLRKRETNLALAAGVNLILTPHVTVALSKAHMMSPTGRCHAFDAGADGYVRGEGCAVLVLKRLSDALAEGDSIAAVIRGTAVNHDGRSAGLSAPNGQAQERVLRAALADARVDPADIEYVEAHGTGTRLGDPIEVEALRSVFCTARTRENPLRIGSVKTNIGHLESVAGFAGLIKSTLMLRHHLFPPHLHVRQFNPLLKLDDGLIEIPTTLREWPSRGRPRLLGVSAFGFGGTNSHIILEEAPADSTRDVRESGPWMLTLSARNSQALQSLARRYLDLLDEHSDLRVANLAHGAAVCREHFDHRVAIRSESLSELRRGLHAVVDEQQVGILHRGQILTDRAPRIAFLFTGQGSQYAGMGLGLYRSEPVFRDALERCARGLEGILDRPLMSLLNPDAGLLLEETGYTQPVLFSLGYALACLWRSWGVEPSAVMGHSVGEFAAACVAGVLSLDDGLKIISGRARLMQSLPAGGQMAAVFADETRVRRVLDSSRGRVTVAALNGPENTVISGDSGAVRLLLDELAAAGIRSQLLATSHAFHSHRLDPILPALAEVAGRVHCNEPAVPIVSNLTGQLADRATFARPDYFSQHARLPVQFSQGMQTLAAMGCDVFLEMGPSPTLIGMGRRCLTASGPVWLPSLRQGREDRQVLLDSVAQLYVRGGQIDWSRFYSQGTRRRGPLPTYPFQRRRFWVQETRREDQPKAILAQSALLHPLLGRRLTLGTREDVFSQELTGKTSAGVAEYRLQEVTVLPVASLLEMMLAVSTVRNGRPEVLRDIVLADILSFVDSPQILHTVYSTEESGGGSVRIVRICPSEDALDPGYETLAVGRFCETDLNVAVFMDLESMRSELTVQAVSAQRIEESLSHQGIESGLGFRWISRVWMGGAQAIAELRSAHDEDRTGPFQVVPGWLDAGFQLLSVLAGGGTESGCSWWPVAVGVLEVRDRLQAPPTVGVELLSQSDDHAVGRIVLFDDSGRIIVTADQVRLHRLPRDWRMMKAGPRVPDWVYRLNWVPLELTGADGLRPDEPAHWLVFDECNSSGEALVERLRASGRTAIRVSSDLAPAERRRVLLQQRAEGGTGRVGVVCFIASTPSSEPGFTAVEDELAREAGGVLDVLQGLAAPLESRAGASAASTARLWLVTRGAMAAGPKAAPIDLTHSSIWGLGRVIALEFPGLECTRIDLDPGIDGAIVDRLFSEILEGLDEDQIAFRGGERYVARLSPWRPDLEGVMSVPVGLPHQLVAVSDEGRQQLQLRSFMRRPPGRGQVEIRVVASSVSDGQKSGDRSPGRHLNGWGSCGCAGIITAVGRDVDGWFPGDAVVALASDCLASHVVTRADLVARKPESFDFDQAAGASVQYTTARLALRQLEAQGPKPRVLICGASRGAGLAVLQLALQDRIDVYAIAGSSEEQEVLFRLGCPRVFPSPLLDGGEQLLRVTGNEGFDLVIGAIADAVLPVMRSLIRVGGRGISWNATAEVCRLWSNTDSRSTSWSTLCLPEFLEDDPVLVGRALREALELLTRENSCPLALTRRPLDRFNALAMSRSRSVPEGDLIIQSIPIPQPGDAPVSFGPDGTLLITGGLGGLGLRLVEWLVDRGARNLVLLSRSDPSKPVQKALDELGERGANVVVRRVNVASRSEVDELLKRVRVELPPLKGIFHLAGVLDDGILLDQNRDRFRKVMAGKSAGAWNLHELTAADPIEWFVLFSSAASLVGSPGQGNYAAANAYLDGLAHHRRWLGLPAISINWGAWAEVGMAARLTGTDKDRSAGSVPNSPSTDSRRLSALGFGQIDPAQGLVTLGHILRSNPVQVGVVAVDWSKIAERVAAGTESGWMRDILQEHRKRGVAASRGAEGSGTVVRAALWEELQSALPSERIDKALAHLRRLAGRIMALPESELPDPHRTINELGFDSLTGVELVNGIGLALGRPLTPTVLYDHPTLGGLARFLVLDFLRLDGDGVPAMAAIQDPESEAAAAVLGLSDEGLNELVQRQLERLAAGDSSTLASGVKPPHSRPDAERN